MKERQESISVPAGDRIVPLLEACKRFGNIHVSTAYRWEKLKKFPTIRKPGLKKAGVLESELNAMIAQVPSK